MPKAKAPARLRDREGTDPVGRLFIVSTPIGNLGDMTFRAVETLRSCDAILCEDTRHSRTLLTHYGIDKPVKALHEHNESQVTPLILGRLQGGESFALISDAGTPLVSDPGARLVRAAIDAGVSVVPIPGASAVLAALVTSGLGDGPFTFFGFLPRKKKERSERLRALSGLDHTGVLYESPNRVVDTLEELSAMSLGGRRAAVLRELTKQFEEVRRGTVSELIEYYQKVPPRGEVVVVLEGREPEGPDLAVLQGVARDLVSEGLGPREVMQRLVNEYGASRNMAYRLAHED